MNLHMDSSSPTMFSGSNLTRSAAAAAADLSALPDSSAEFPPKLNEILS